MPAIMNRDLTLERMEEQQRWCDTIGYLETQWRQNPCLEHLLRVFSQAWFLMSYVEQLPPYKEHFESIKLPTQWPNEWLLCIQQAKTIGDLKYGDNPVYAAVSGHMMAVHPEWFVSMSYDLGNALQEGLNRLHAAQKAIPALYVFSLDVKKSPVKPYFAEQLFPGYSEVDLYFKCNMTGRRK